MTISERIFKLMEEREIAQTDFSKATGIAQSTISDWKRKKTNPSADKIMIICKVLNVTPYELLQDTVLQFLRHTEAHVLTIHAVVLRHVFTELSVTHGLRGYDSSEVLTVSHGTRILVLLNFD